MSFESNFIESNGERFIKADYNGISILIREKDEFINATKIAKDNGKQKNIARYFESEKWKEICEKFNKISLPQKRGNGKNHENYELFYNISNVCIECRGTYVIPDLIHFVAEWCNIEYAFKVNVIMNNINKLKELEHKDGNEFLNTITERLQNKIKDLEEDNGKKQDKIDELLKEVKHQSKRIDELLHENKKQTRKLNKTNNKIDDLKDILKSHKGRLTGEAVKDSKVLMLYLNNDSDNEHYIKIVRSQPEYLRGRDKKIFEQEKYLFLSYLPEAINQNKEILNEVLNKKKFKNIMSLNSAGGKTKININSLNYLKHNYPDDYKEFSDKKIKRKITNYAKEFIKSYEHELEELINNNEDDNEEYSE